MFDFPGYYINRVISERNLSVVLCKKPDVIVGEVLEAGTGPDTLLGAGHSRLLQMTEYVCRRGEGKRGYFFRSMEQLEVRRKHRSQLIGGEIGQSVACECPYFLQVGWSEGAEGQYAGRWQDFGAPDKELTGRGESLQCRARGDDSCSGRHGQSLGIAWQEMYIGQA